VKEIAAATGLSPDQLFWLLALAIAAAAAWRFGLFDAWLKARKQAAAAPPAANQEPAARIQEPAKPALVEPADDVEDLLLKMQRRDDRESDARLIRDCQRARETESLAKALQRRQEGAK
jgi:hypothetical protein